MENVLATVLLAGVVPVFFFTLIPLVSLSFWAGERCPGSDEWGFGFIGLCVYMTGFIWSLGLAVGLSVLYVKGLKLAFSL